MRTTTYADRTEAGRLLAQELDEYTGRDDVVVIGLPRGGVPVAAEVAAALDAPLDVVVIRKLGLPQQPELAMGAVTAVGEAVTVVRNDAVVRDAGVDEEEFDGVLAVETAELRRREALYRGDSPPAEVEGRTVVVVDDGLATGASMRAALAALRTQEPARLVVAVPVGAPDTCASLEADDVVCPWVPDRFSSVGQAYADFGQTTDDEVRELLETARRR